MSNPFHFLIGLAVLAPVALVLGTFARLALIGMGMTHATFGYERWLFAGGFDIVIGVLLALAGVLALVKIRRRRLDNAR
jgi:hypothetical protein